MNKYLFIPFFCLGVPIFFTSCEECVTCKDAVDSVEFCSAEPDKIDEFEDAWEVVGYKCTTN